jgi:hypothetical protein
VAFLAATTIVLEWRRARKRIRGEADLRLRSE